MAYRPRFSITPPMAGDLMRIQEACAVVEHHPLPSSIMRELRHESLVETAILSTKIEGNLLDEQSKRAAVRGPAASSDEQEVHNLAKAVDFLAVCQQKGLPITEDLVKQLHAVIKVIGSGRRPRYSPYRTVQNKVGERGSGQIVYMPPEPRDVPPLMEELVAWVNSTEAAALPVPIRAGLFLYQFLTIHPYLDGNGRTGRALATYILQTGGYGLKGLFVLERYYDRHLRGYYDNLQTGLNHNYYFGRNDAEITRWLAFFITGLAEVFTEAADIVRAKSAEFSVPEPPLLRGLDVHQRAVFAQLALRTDHLTVTDVVRLTGLADRTVRAKVKNWIAADFLAPTDPGAQRIRSVRLAPRYRELADEVGESPQSFKYLLR